MEPLELRDPSKDEGVQSLQDAPSGHGEFPNITQETIILSQWKNENYGLGPTLLIALLLLFLFLATQELIGLAKMFEPLTIVYCSVAFIVPCLFFLVSYNCCYHRVSCTTILVFALVGTAMYTGAYMFEFTFAHVNANLEKLLFGNDGWYHSFYSIIPLFIQGFLLPALTEEFVKFLGGGLCVYFCVYTCGVLPTTKNSCSSLCLPHALSAYPRKAIETRYGISLCVLCVSACLSGIENITYIRSQLISDKSAINLLIAVVTLGMRGLLALPLHFCTGLLMGSIMALILHKKVKDGRYFSRFILYRDLWIYSPLILIGPVLIHGTYDFTLVYGSSIGSLAEPPVAYFWFGLVGLAILTLIVGWIVTWVLVYHNVKLDREDRGMLGEGETLNEMLGSGNGEAESGGCGQRNDEAPIELEGGFDMNGVKSVQEAESNFSTSVF